MRVLVVEDNPVSRLLVVRFLEGAGHEATVAENGKEALALVACTPFDLALMDLQMPIMDGYQATAGIRALERGTERHLRIVAMTAHVTPGYHEHCLEMGMDDYLCKPIQPRLLLQAIAAIPASRTDAQHGAAHDLAAAIPPTDGLAGDMELRRELAALFLEDCPPLMSRIRAAIDGRDGPALKLAAHTLKGSAGVFKDQPTHAAAFHMERIGRDAEWDHAETAWRTLTSEMERLSATLRKEFPGE